MLLFSSIDLLAGLILLLSVLVMCGADCGGIFRSFVSRSRFIDFEYEYDHYKCDCVYCFPCRSIVMVSL